MRQYPFLIKAHITSPWHGPRQLGSIRLFEEQTEQFGNVASRLLGRAYAGIVTVTRRKVAGMTVALSVPL